MCNKVTGVGISRTTLTLEETGTHRLTATIAPPKATNPNVTWSSSNTSVAKGNIVVKATMSEKDAEETIKLAADKKRITTSLDNFISGSGSGNTTKSLSINQNRYDALFSYFYSNGGSVFTDSKYDEWNGYGGEYALRAKARKELRDYIITNNGNYNPETVIKLFINSKGANIKYEYEDRRRTEANLFNK